MYLKIIHTYVYLDTTIRTYLWLRYFLRLLFHHGSITTIAMSWETPWLRRLSSVIALVVAAMVRPPRPICLVCL